MKKIIEAIWNFLKKNILWILLVATVIFVGLYIYEKINSYLTNKQFDNVRSVLSEQYGLVVNGIEDILGIVETAETSNRELIEYQQELTEQVKQLRSTVTAFLTTTAEIGEGLANLTEYNIGIGEDSREIERYGKLAIELNKRIETAITATINRISGQESGTPK
jgi:hypothetical protein